MATTPTKEGVSPLRRGKKKEEEVVERVLTKSEIKVNKYKDLVQKKLDEEFP
jgi:hypothetical protein